MFRYFIMGGVALVALLLSKRASDIATLRKALADLPVAAWETDNHWEYIAPEFRESVNTEKALDVVRRVQAKGGKLYAREEFVYGAKSWTEGGALVLGGEASEGWAEIPSL